MCLSQRKLCVKCNILERTTLHPVIHSICWHFALVPISFPTHLRALFPHTATASWHVKLEQREGRTCIFSSEAVTVHFRSRLCSVQLNALKTCLNLLVTVSFSSPERSGPCRQSLVRAWLQSRLSCCVPFSLIISLARLLQKFLRS